MGKKFSIKYSGLRLDFEITKEKKIVLLYCGEESKRKRKVFEEVLKPFNTFVEADYLPNKENKHRGLKLAQTAYGMTYRYVRHSLLENDKGQELIIVTTNKVLTIETHIQLYKDIKALSSFNVVKNVCKSSLDLLYVSSFYQQGLFASNSDKTFLYQASNSWHVEAQWHKHSFRELGIINGNNNTSMGRYSINNTGSWSTKEHLPMVVIEDKSRKSATLVQIENNGSWHIEIGDYINEVYVSASGPEFYDNQWLKVLNPNDTFTTCQATLTFGKDFEETIQEITKVRRVLRRNSNDLETLPIIYNDYMHALWDTQTTELILPLVDVASAVNCEEFCMDAGWFANGSDWWSILGKWEEFPENFPGGFIKVFDYIRSKNMKAGIWFEIEAVGVDSPILEIMDDSWFFQINGKPIVNNNRYQLNFANPKVYEYALGVIDKAMSLYHLDYIKIDYNVDAGIGNSYESDSLGDGLLRHNRAYIRWLNEVMDKYPNLTIENCGSGGCRMDYEILKLCPIQSTSDQTNYRKYPYLSTNVLTACPPEQAAVWSYPLNDYEKIMPTDEVVVMNMCNAMLGRIHLASFLNKLPESQLDLIREGLAFYKSIAEMKIHSIPFFPKGTSEFFSKEVIGGIMDDKTGVLGVWNTSGKSKSIKVNLSKYDFKDLEVGYPTSLSTNWSYDKDKKVLEVFFPEDYGGRIFKFCR